MNEFVKRIITGFIYIFLLLSAIMLDADAFDFLFLSFGIICLFEFKMLIKLRGLYIFIAFLFMWWVFIHLRTSEFSVYLLLLTTILVNSFLVLDLFSEKKPLRLRDNNYKFFISLVYIGAGCIFMPLIYKYELFNSYTKLEAQLTMIGILCIIWASDSFAYLIGKSLGKHKLLERISPKKTIEGTLGGLVGAIITASIISTYTEKTTWHWIVLSIVLVITGTLGDLVESRFKRVARVKDSGTSLPGHGGLLDRLDSLIFASPFAFLTLQFLAYVS
ncbi:phosphatidate cytidylyltransferase [Capnocytophaga canimorsus]|uniref:Phosphatidate cytidylyltransferase n=1 Tax=Capnocytophaga canimorsus TaxID=28188 RepID=A0A250G8V0_9FLAO|nr:phosphatidate cytidylyltransferase [Capnocytophaga canimorsus]ATA92617.1 phosphatidate cytidylyltransferase [Capnocytophaga canimorsus]